MKKRNLSDEEMNAIREAIKGIVGNEDFDVEGQVFTGRPNNEMTSVEICAELDALADELEQIERKAEMLIEKALAMDLNSDGAARLFYALDFMVKMNADAQRALLQLAVDFIRKQSQGDAR